MDTMQDQLLLDITKIAKQYANEEGITDPVTIGHIMHGIRLGTARGIQMALSLNAGNESNSLNRDSSDQLPF